MGILVIVALLAIAAANTAWWWLVDREHLAHIGHLKGRLKSLHPELAAAKQAVHIAEMDNAQLRERNTMLTDLVGERSP